MSLAYCVGALVLAAAVRLYLFQNDYIINNDGVVYIESARRFWEGDWLGGLSGFYPPLFPLMIATAFSLTGEWELAGRLWPLVLSILILFPLFGLLRRIYNLRVAYMALFLFAVSPYLARLSVDVRSEIPYIFFLLCATYFFQLAIDQKRGSPLFLAGISSALAYLIRPEAIGFLAVGVVFLLYRARLNGVASKMWIPVSVLFLGFFVLAAPYVLYLKWDTGKWLFTRKAGNAVSQGMSVHDPSTAVVSQEESVQVDALELIRSHPLSYAKKVFIDFFRFIGFYFEAVHYAYLPFLFLGWILFFRGRFWEKKDFLLVILVGFYIAAFPLLYVTRRYSVPLVPVSLGWVAVGSLTVWEYSRARWEKAGSFLMGLLAGAFALGTLPKTLVSVGREKLYFREAGLYLKSKPGNPTIFTHDSRVAFYARGSNHVRVVGIEEALASRATARTYLTLDNKLLESTKGALGTMGWVREREFSGSTGDGLVILLLNRKAPE